MWQENKDKNSIGDLSLGTLITTLEKTSRRVSPRRARLKVSLFQDSLWKQYWVKLSKGSLRRILLKIFDRARLASTFAWRCSSPKEGEEDKEEEESIGPDGAAPQGKAKKKKKKITKFGRTELDYVKGCDTEGHIICVTCEDLGKLGKDKEIMYKAACKHIRRCAQLAEETMVDWLVKKDGVTQQNQTRNTSHGKVVKTHRCGPSLFSTAWQKRCEDNGETTANKKEKQRVSRGQTTQGQTPHLQHHGQRTHNYDYQWKSDHWNSRQWCASEWGGDGWSQWGGDGWGCGDGWSHWTWGPDDGRSSGQVPWTSGRGGAPTAKPTVTIKAAVEQWSDTKPASPKKNMRAPPRSFPEKIDQTTDIKDFTTWFYMESHRGFARNLFAIVR